MAHYRLSERFPSAIITSGGNEKKIYEGGYIYLNDGENFEIRFFNPTQYKLGVEIIFNGYKKGDGYLVLNPGQDVTLDRFLDEQRKMIFETYTIDGNNQAAVEAIQKNGLIEFNFYKESYYHPIHYSASAGGYQTSGFSGYSGGSGCIGQAGVAGTNGPGFATTHYTNTFDTSPLDYFYDADLKQTVTSNSNNRIYEKKRQVKAVETGRVEMGDVSNQTLNTVNDKFENVKFHSVSYKMLPYSAKPVEISEIRQYCPKCGYRLRKQSWVFCPSCGSKIE